MSAVVVVDVVGDDVPPPTTGVAADKEKQPSSLPHSHCLEFVRRAWLQLCASFAVLLIGSAIALYLFYTLGDIQRVNVRTIYNRRAGQLAEGLQSQIHSVQVDLVALGTQLQLQPNTTRAQFKAAVERVNKVSMRPCSDCWHALVYAPCVTQDERGLYESRARADLNDTTLVFRNTSKTFPNKNPIEPEYIPVYYIEPFAGNKGAVGFNLASAAGRNDTITRARRLGQTQATPPIELVQEDKFEGSSLALLIMHPFNFTPGLQPGKSGTQGFINGVVRLKTLLEHFLKSHGDHVTVSLIDDTESSEFFEGPMFLHEIELDETGIIRSQSKGLSVADVERKAQKADLLYEGVVDCFSRKWKVLIYGDPDDYSNIAFSLHAIISLIVFAATMFIFGLVLFIVVQHDQAIKTSETTISKLEVESERQGKDFTTRRTSLEGELNRVVLDLRLLIDTANAPIFGIDKQGRVNEWNLKAAAIVGYESDEVMGRNLVEDFISPEYREAVKGVLDDALQGHDTANFEFSLFTKTGGRVDVLLNATPRRDVNGAVTGMVGVGQNITDRKTAEGELKRAVLDLRMLIDTANAPIFGIDHKGLVNEWNLKAAEIVGYEKDEVMGRDLVEDFVSPEYRQAVKGVLDDALQGRDTSSFEFPLFTKRGGRVDVLLNATPRRDVKGAITGMVGVGHDVTEKRKAMKTEVDLSKAEAANSAKSEFLANMSHEMRTPLNGVIAVNQLLLETQLDDEQRELSNLVRTSADSLLCLINDILDLTRVESGKLELEYFDFDARNTVEDALDSVIMKACSKGIEVICAIGRNMPVRSRGDGDRLKQIVLNLLSNAIKFTQSGEVEVTTTLESETATHHVTRVSVRDTGIGISEDAQSKLFSRFTQVDSSTTRNYGGSGLGLAISKQLVELMSGTMGVSSTPGKGSTFWFEVLLEKAETLVEEVRQLPSAMRPMLVVSTNNATRSTLTDLLAAWGADVSAAADEDEAKIYVNSHPIVTSIISLTIPEYNVAVLKPIMDFITASIREVRFWIILCPINFMGKVRGLVAALAETFDANDDVLAANAARSMVIMSTPVRQGVLYDCLTHLSRYGVYRKSVEYDADIGELRPGRMSRSNKGASCTSLVESETSLDTSSIPDNEARNNSPDMSHLQSEARAFNVLVAEDSLANQMAIRRMLEKHGALVTVVGTGSEAVDAVVTRGLRFDMAFFDINMPIMGGIEALHLIRQATIDMPVVAISVSVSNEELQKLTNEGFSMVTTKPLLKVPCMEILTKYGHVLPPNILRKLGPAADSQETSSSALTSAWSEDSSAVMSPALTFLVVEDNKTSRRILQRIMEREGFTVSFAVNGIEAVEKAKESDFSAILMDGNLPLKDGWQATREIRECEVARGTKRIPIIAITANAMRGDRELCIDAGMDDYIAKPVQRQALLQKIQHWTRVPIPLLPETMAPLTALSAIAPAQEGRANSTWLKKGQLCVLIVMHNTTERLLLKHVCQMEGCMVDTCGTGLKALQNMTSNGDSYALCLVDTVLPDIEPHSLISQMSELVRGQAASKKPNTNARPVPLVLMGTSAFAPSRAAVMEAGCEDLLQKPVSRSALRSLLDRINVKATNIPASTPVLKNTLPRLAETHVLYAEDSKPIQKIMIRMLEKAGAKVTVVDDGKAAVEASLNNPMMFDCILMDCNMPVMDGWEATQKIQKVLGHRVPIVAVTANALAGDREKCLQQGMDDYITKPVKLSLLLDIVEQWTSQNKLGVTEGGNTSANDTGGGKSNISWFTQRWSSFSIRGTLAESLKEHDRMLTVASPAKQPVDLLTFLEQVDGDSDFVIEMLRSFCTGAKKQLESCNRAARVCDTATLSSEAHAMKGGAATCCATQLANLCGGLEHMARLEQDSVPATSGTSPQSPGYWIRMVDDISACLDKVSYNLDALASMRMLPSFNSLMNVYGSDRIDDVISALCNLPQVAVNGYVAAHAAIFKDKECDIGEVSFGTAIEKLGLACVVAKDLSVKDLFRTAELLSKHLLMCPTPPSGETLKAVHRTIRVSQRMHLEQTLDDMRVTIESLTAELLLILGERMPVLAIPFSHDAGLESEVDAEAGNPLVTSDGVPVSRDWICEPICDYRALMHNTGDDHLFVTALLKNFKDNLYVFGDGLDDQTCSLFDAHSLHGAALSMCMPRVAAAISDFIVASKKVLKSTAVDVADPIMNRRNNDTVESAIRDFRAAIDEVATFIQALENGVSSPHVMMRR